MIPPIEDGVFYGPSGERMDTRPPIDRARLARLEAVAAAAEAVLVGEWWAEKRDWIEPLTCRFCGAWEPDGDDPWRHAPDCPALALDAALAALRDAGGEA